MSREWVDFSVVKNQVTMAMVLEHYEITGLRGTGENRRGRCPIHQGAGERSFNVNLTKNVFQCFSCKAKGNILDLVAALESVSVRDAALKLAEWFDVGGEAGEGTRPEATPSKPAPTEPDKPINPPLGFELQVDSGHEYGLSRGVSPETLQTFGAGFCRSRGMFAGRFIVPLHNGAGELVGYAGRVIDDQEPKYLFPSAERGFRKSHLLFNLHRVGETVFPVAVVEGFFDCMKVSAAGFPVVGLLGSSLSKEQEDLLAEHFDQVILCLDGDDAGRSATDDCVKRLAHRMFVRAVDVPDGRQPDDMTSEELEQLLSLGI